MPRRFWTPARVAELKLLWRAGKSAAAIGAAFGGITRSAVLGKVFRLRLSATDAPGDRGEPPARRRAGKAPPVVQTKSRSRRKTLFELTNECCRWPYGELGGKRFFFCGAPGADAARGIAYCPRHMARAYIVPPTLVKPLHKLIARGPKKVSSVGAADFRSFPRKRESSGVDPARSIFSGFPLSRERAVTNKRKSG
jgi:GcrA cell cycle regulator